MAPKKKKTAPPNPSTKTGLQKPLKKTAPSPRTYRHPEATSPWRPEVGTQSQFRK